MGRASSASRRRGRAIRALRTRPAQRDDQDRAGLSLLVQIATEEIDDAACWVSSWIQEREGRWRPRPGPWAPNRMTLDQAESYVVSLIEVAELAWRNSTSLGDSLRTVRIVDLE